MDSQRFLDLMAVDKKVQAGKLRLVLMHGIGKSVITDKATPEQIRAAIEDHRQGA